MSRWSQAGIVLVRSDPRDVVRAIKLSRATYRKMLQNLGWATAYNVIAIPAAAGVFVHWGIGLPISVGALTMTRPSSDCSGERAVPSSLAAMTGEEFLNLGRM